MELKPLAQQILDNVGLNTKHWNTIQKESVDRDELKKAIDLVDPRFKQRLFDEFFELGPLNTLIQDPEVDEILIFENESICYEKSGQLILHKDTFLTNSTFINFFEDVTRSFFKSISYTNPTGNGTWKNFRVHVIAPPLSSLKHISLRRNGGSKIKNLEHLEKLNFLSTTSHKIILEALKNKLNLLICGATSSGKTTFIQCLINEIQDERLIIIEDSIELQPPNSFSTSLICPTRQEQYNLNFTMKDLIKESLRMRPDRIVLGEARSDEAKDFIQALSTGHKGCIASLHASSARDALIRLECLIAQGAPEWSTKTIKNLIFNALDLVIFVEKKPQGLRKVQQIVELSSLETDSILTEEIYNSDNYF